MELSWRGGEYEMRFKQGLGFVGFVGRDLGLVDGEIVGGFEQEMVEMGFVYVYIFLFGGVQFELFRGQNGDGGYQWEVFVSFQGCCNGWDGVGEKQLDI